jgi:hypothetical protein
MRKKTPLVLPSRPSCVSVGDEAATETWTTPAGAVTDVSIAMEGPEVIAPMMTGTFLMLTSWVAWSTATLAWLWLSRVSSRTLQPSPKPPAVLRSFTAISMALAPAWP